MSRLENKIALITGASRGLGAAVARAYAREGAHVVLVARTIGALEALDDEIKSQGGVSTLVPLDLMEGDKIDQLGGVIAERFGKLDILVGNAGILGVLSPVAHYDPKIWDKTIATNVTANFRLIRSFDPLLRAAPQGRAIFVTSGYARHASPNWGAYGVSKAALEKLVLTYADEIKHTRVKVNLCDPGVMRTELRAAAMPGEAVENLPLPDEVAEICVTLAEDACSKHGEIIYKGEMDESI